MLRLTLENVVALGRAARRHLTGREQPPASIEEYEREREWLRSRGNTNRSVVVYRFTFDNNAAENALRGTALGRKNWLFWGSCLASVGSGLSVAGCDYQPTTESPLPTEARQVGIVGKFRGSTTRTFGYVALGVGLRRQAMRRINQIRLLAAVRSPKTSANRSRSCRVVRLLSVATSLATFSFIVSPESGSLGG
jgi:hypothetical protein